MIPERVCPSRGDLGAGRAPSGWGGLSSDGGPVLRWRTRSSATFNSGGREVMRKSCQSAGLRTTVLALGFVALTATGVRADAIMNYTTSGSIDSSGVSGPGVISFIPVSNGAFNAPSAFSLGDFQVAALPDAQSTTYTNTPFHITYLANTINGVAPAPNETPIQVSGVLNGDITGSNQSNVVATFDP